MTVSDTYTLECEVKALKDLLKESEHLRKELGEIVVTQGKKLEKIGKLVLTDEYMSYEDWIKLKEILEESN